MPLDTFDNLQIAQHTLRISDPDVSLPFYQDKFGMSLLAHRTNGTATHFYLGFVESDNPTSTQEPNLAKWQDQSFLELIHAPDQTPADIRKQPDSKEGYWKIAISVADLDVARNRLVANGVEVDTPRQIPDIAYLCHCNDPDDYCIELIQHDFLHNHTPQKENSAYALGSRPVFSLITYRVKDAQSSLTFYSYVLGMRLLSKQVVKSRGFTLYFLAYTEEHPPHADIENVDNREWLWQRPYTMVELQHVWGTEDEPDFEYRVGTETGFTGISIATTKFDELLNHVNSKGYKTAVSAVDPTMQVRTTTISDPDGYSLRLIDKS